MCRFSAKKYTPHFAVCRPVEGVRVLKTCWKHQKSKGYNFLHRNCTQLFFSTPKNIFSEVDRKKMCKKSENFQKSFRVLKIFLCNLQRKIFKTLKEIFWDFFRIFENEKFSSKKIRKIFFLQKSKTNTLG